MVAGEIEFFADVLGGYGFAVDHSGKEFVIGEHGKDGTSQQVPGFGDLGGAGRCVRRLGSGQFEVG